MPRRLAQQLMTSSDLEWPHRALSAVAELLVDYAVCHKHYIMGITGLTCSLT